MPQLLHNTTKCLPDPRDFTSRIYFVPEEFQKKKLRDIVGKLLLQDNPTLL